MSIGTPISAAGFSASFPEPIWRLSVDQYHEMIRAGILTADDPVELLDGCLVQKMPKYPLHSLVTEELRDWLNRVFGPKFFARSQEPITLSKSEPEPDVALIRGTRKQFALRHPGPAEVALVAEVSDTTLRRDRGFKKRIYAEAGIVQYWIVNLVDRQIEVYTEPDMASGDYGQKRIFGLSDEVPVTVDGTTVGTLRLDEILPSA